jgi:hypothetical protein
MRRAHRRAHRRIWFLLAVLLPAALILALATRQNGPRDAPPVRLAPP